MTLLLDHAAHHVIHQLSNDVNRLYDNWCLSPQGCKLLQVLAQSIQAKNICEVGTSIGFSTLHLALAASQTQGHVHTIDYYESRQSQAKQHITQAELSEFVTFHQGQALDVINQFVANKQQFDFVFIDAAKKEYFEYFKILSALMPVGSIFVADNTLSHREQMQDFIDVILNDARFTTSDLDTPNGLIISYKNSL